MPTWIFPAGQVCHWCDALLDTELFLVVLWYNCTAVCTTKLACCTLVVGACKASCLLSLWDFCVCQPRQVISEQLYLSLKNFGSLIFEHVLYTGSYEMDVATWRPTGRRFTDRLKRFFIGGPPEVDDITYVACRKDFKVIFILIHGSTSGNQ